MRIFILNTVFKSYIKNQSKFIMHQDYNSIQYYWFMHSLDDTKFMFFKDIIVSCVALLQQEVKI